MYIIVCSIFVYFNGSKHAETLNILLLLSVMKSDHSVSDGTPDFQHLGVHRVVLPVPITCGWFCSFPSGLVSSIGRGFAKLRRNSEGKNNVTSGSNYSLTNESELASHSQSLSVTAHHEEFGPPPTQPSATPVVIRKRKMSGEETVPFSATKRWVWVWLEDRFLSFEF